MSILYTTHPLAVIVNAPGVLLLPNGVYGNISFGAITGPVIPGTRYLNAPITEHGHVQTPVGPVTPCGPIGPVNVGSCNTASNFAFKNISVSTAPCKVDCTLLFN